MLGLCALQRAPPFTHHTNMLTNLNIWELICYKDERQISATTTFFIATLNFTSWSLIPQRCFAHDFAILCPHHSKFPTSQVFFTLSKHSSSLTRVCCLALSWRAALCHQSAVGAPDQPTGQTAPDFQKYKSTFVLLKSISSNTSQKSTSRPFYRLDLIFYYLQVCYLQAYFPVKSQ